jgi:superfamily II DNA or RNA helicase
VLCYKEHDGGLVASAGFLPRIVKTLRADGVDVKFEDLREKRLPEPDYSRLDKLWEGQDDMISAIVANDCGIVESPTASGKGFVIRQLCKLWPQAKIIICSYTIDIVRQLYTDLSEMFPVHEIGMVGGGMHDARRRITCVVDKSLERCNLDGCDLFIYDEVHRAGAEETKKLIGRVRNAKMIGFSASPKGRGDNTDMEVEALFGPVIYKQTYQTSQASGNIVPIRAYIFSTANCPDRQYMSTTALERNLIWKSYERNSIIVSAVDWVIKELGGDPQILITVKTVTHAVYLGKLLPSFELVYAQMSAEDRDEWARKGLIGAFKHPLTSERRRLLYDEFRAGKLRRAIATSIWSTGVDFKGLNVLVRADAQASTIANIQLPGRVSRTSDGKDVGILIDFNDVFNQTLAGRAQKRMAIYRKKGWELTNR